MKRVVNILVGLLLPMALFAQWEVGANMGALISRSNRADEPNFTVERSATFLPELVGAYTFGSKSQWNVSFGASLFTKRFRLEPTNLWEGAKPDACRYHYFSLPVLLTYRIPIQDKFWLGISCGFQGDLYLGQKTPELTYNGETFNRYGLDGKEMNHGFEMSVGAEFGYNINDHWKALFTYRNTFDLVNADERGFLGKFRSNILAVGVRYVFSTIETVIPYDVVAEY